MSVEQDLVDCYEACHDLEAKAREAGKRLERAKQSFEQSHSQGGWYMVGKAHVVEVVDGKDGRPNGVNVYPLKGAEAVTEKAR